MKTALLVLVAVLLNSGLAIAQTADLRTARSGANLVYDSKQAAILGSALRSSVIFREPVLAHSKTANLRHRFQFLREGQIQETVVVSFDEGSLYLSICPANFPVRKRVLQFAASNRTATIIDCLQYVNGIDGSAGHIAHRLEVVTIGISAGITNDEFRMLSVLRVQKSSMNYVPQVRSSHNAITFEF